MNESNKNYFRNQDEVKLAYSLGGANWMILISCVVMGLIVSILTWLSRERYKLGRYDTTPMVMVILLTVFFILLMLYYTIKKIVIHGRRFKAKKELYGEEVILSQIYYGTQMTIESKTPYSTEGTVYFTTDLLIVPSLCIIDYNEIDIIYPVSGHKQVYRIKCILVDGTEYDMAYSAWQYESDFMNYCKLKNNRIMLGKDRKHMIKHKANVTAYKLGVLNYPHANPKYLTKQVYEEFVPPAMKLEFRDL